jgi:hypothetical protein
MAKPFSDELYALIYSLENDFFSTTGDRMLCFPATVFHEYDYSEIEIEIMAENLERLAKMAHEQGAQLFFMPCVEKYHLYYPWIIKGEKIQNP